MQRAGWIIFGVVTTVVGLGLMFFANQFVGGGLLGVCGLLRLMTAFSIDSRSVRSHPAPSDDPRWLEDRAGVKRTQLAGKKCIECGRKITVASEGVTCDICEEPSHVQCNNLHRTHAHRPEAVGPFR